SYNNDNHNITFVEGYIGLCAKFVGDDSYVRYPGNILPADKGSIEFYWKPPENIYELYSYRHEEWTDFGSYKPPSAGFLLDNIGWRAAPVGSFSLVLMPIDWKNPDSPISWIGWSMWSGSKWYWARSYHCSRPTLYAEVKDSKVKLSWNSTHPIWIWDPNVWYHITVTWGSNGLHLYVNGKEWANNSYKGSICTSKSFALGQDPGYWPYGPHSMRGFYDEFKIYDEQIVPTPSNAETSKPAGYIIYYGNKSGEYAHSIDVGNVSSYELTLSPGKYYFAIAAKTSTGFVGPLSKEVEVNVSTSPQKRISEIYYRIYDPTTGLSEQIKLLHTVGAAGAPTITMDSNGTLYVAWQQKEATGKWQVYYSTSKDGGKTWSTPVALGDPTKNNSCPVFRWSYYNYYNSSLVDLVWVNYTDWPDTSVMLTTFKDGTLIQTSVVNPNAYGGSNSITRDSTGTIHVLFGKHPGRTYHTSSKDGITWTAPTLVYSDPDSAAQYSDLAVDSKDILHGVYTFNVGGFYIRSTNGGETWSRQALVDGGWGAFDKAGSITVDQNDVVHVIYEKAYGWGDHPMNIFYRKSTDGGLTWSAPTQLTFEPNRVPGSGVYDNAGYTFRAIEAGPGNNLYVTYLWRPYQEAYFGPGNWGKRWIPGDHYRFYIQRFNGSGWEAPVEISYPGRNTSCSLHPMVVDQTGKVHIVYQVWWFAPGNQSPIANFTYSPERPIANQTITFDASSSYDPDGTIVSYEWDFGDGSEETTTSPTIQHS
ncbi:hypothetical protein DRO29_06995, partial [Candidatus Bathyarchaeota archaeon]